MGTIDFKYDLDQEVWVLKREPKQVWVTCPECLGNKTVKLTLGNGEEYNLPCRACSSGYDPPKGVIREYDRNIYPIKVTIGDIELKRHEIRYIISGFGYLNEDQLFSTEEECRIACAEEILLTEEEDARKATIHLESSKKDLAWSVHYWRFKKNEAKKDMEAAERRLGICREKNKDKKNGIQ